MSGIRKKEFDPSPEQIKAVKTVSAMKGVYIRGLSSWGLDKTTNVMMRLPTPTNLFNRFMEAIITLIRSMTGKLETTHDE